MGGLQHCNQEAQRGLVSQVLLIGDAPANTPDDVRRKRAGGMWYPYNEAYWNEDPRFKTPTTSDKEIRALKARRIPVHSYWLTKHGSEEPFFKSVAAATGGKSQFLDVDSDAGRDML